MSTRSSLSRRTTLRTLTGAGVALSAVGLAQNTVLAQPATPTAPATHPVVGAWRIVPDPPVPPLVLILYHADGTLIFSAPSSSAAEPGAGFATYQDTPAYGAWEPVGDRGVALSASLIESDEAGAYLGTLNFHGTARLDDTLDAYVYSGVVEVVDPAGTLVTTLPVTTRATRIRVDRAKAEASTPAAGTPAP